jgi:two-component system, chemotaxis family, sensor kinase CheA
LPDNGRPMLLLDASGLGQALGIDQREDQRAVSAEPNEERQAKRPSALLFVAKDGIKRAVRLSVIDRMEDVDAANIKFVGGRMRASIGDRLFDVCDLDDAPEQGLVKLLRLTDGADAKYLAVEDVIDIFTLDGEIAPSACPEIYEGVVSAFGETVELINVFRYFEMDGGASVAIGARPLCYVQCDDESIWEQRILAPLLVASGYNVSFEAADRESAAVVLSRGGDGQERPADDARILRLRDTSHPAADSRSSIYRYDRIGLISAIEAKLSGVA